MTHFDPDLKELLEEQEYVLIESEDEFNRRYPEPSHGEYRPQPYYTPDNYPVMMREEAVVSNYNGADHAVLSFIYPKDKED